MINQKEIENETVIKNTGEICLGVNSYQNENKI